MPALGHRRDLVRRLLLAVDALVLTGALGCSMFVNGPQHVRPLLAAAVLSLVAIAIHGLYGRDEGQIDRQTADDLPGLAQAVTIAAFAVLAGLVVAGSGSGPARSVLVLWLLAIVVLPFGRAVARSIARRQVAYQQTTIVLGAGQIGQLVARKIVAHPEYGLRLLGFVDANPRELEGELGSRVLGGLEHLDEIVTMLGVDRVIVAFSTDDHADVLDALDGLRRRGVRVDLVPRLFEAVGPRLDVSQLEGLPLLTLRSREPARGALWTKRALDVLVAALLLTISAPIFALIALLIRLDSKGGVLYRGRRVGTGGETFEQLKFRTMRPEWCAPNGVDEKFMAYLAERGLADEFARTQKLRNDPRVTTIGRILRRTSLDELPQLWNVLRGDLALVGPRPITERERSARYWDVTRGRPFLGYWEISGLRPGLTGWWQINGRSTMSFEERIRLDTAYLTNWSLGLDLHILAKTVRTLVSTSGAY